MFFIFCNSILSGHSMLCPYLLGYRILHLSLFDYKHLNVGTYHGTSEKTTKIRDNTTKGCNVCYNLWLIIECYSKN